MTKTLAEAKQLLVNHINDLKAEETKVRLHRQRHEEALRNWNLEDEIQSSLLTVDKDES